jgi:hypothetical protein
MKKLLFNQLLLPSVLDRSKTMTRREVKCPHNAYGGLQAVIDPVTKDVLYMRALDEDERAEKPNGEEWVVPTRYSKGEIVYIPEPYSLILNIKGDDLTPIYKIGNNPANFSDIRWQNSMFMPQKYARTFAEITSVRIERLQDISEEDCLKEGIFSNALETKFGLPSSDKTELKFIFGTNLKAAFAALIDKVCKKGTWMSNPFVEVYEFKLIEK